MKPDKSIVQETEHSMTDLRRPTAAAVPPPNRVRVASAYLFLSRARARTRRGDSARRVPTPPG